MQRMRLTTHLLLLLGSVAPLAAGTVPTLTILPANPTTHEPTVARFDDLWFDGCTPQLTGVAISRSPAALPVLPHTVVVATLETDNSGGCPAAVTGYRVDVPLGALPLGTATVVVQAKHPVFGDEPQELARTDFAITDSPRTALPLHDGTVEVTVRWSLPDNNGPSSGDGQVLPGFSTDSGAFSFFRPGNWELFVKVLDACEVNGHYWVYGAGATDVGFTVDVEHTSGATWSHTNASGTLAGTFADTLALPCPEP
jgi:hypothetical protein